MESRLWDALIGDLVVLFLGLFAWSENCFVEHHMIPISFGVISSLGALRAYDTYKAENASVHVCHL